jgi:choloylglycine hydrolase
MVLNMKKGFIRITLIFSALVLMNIKAGEACTIFYICKNGIILGGANEDWKDPATYMWFYPADSSGYAWVKFGFGSGFPQAGMNENGLFWDGTSNPYLAMPESEAGKILYDGPIMEKVIRKSAVISDADEIFAQYYCQDQYRAQYLIGDSSGSSMIVEGDNILYADHSYQVLTNFYHSEPELGGYPCWRHDKAVEILDSCTRPSVYTAAYLLSSTHQDGNYPTQYSLIFLPASRQIVLYYYHNYDEYLLLNLQEQFQKGYKKYALPPLFSRITLSGPVNNSEVGSDSVTISWKGIPGRYYEVLLSQSPEFEDVVITGFSAKQDTKEASAMIFVLFGLVTGAVLIRRDMVKSLLLILGFSLMLSSCQKETEDKSVTDPRVSMTKTFSGLEADTTYYWKISASNETSGGLTTSTPVQKFTTTGFSN